MLRVNAIGKTYNRGEINEVTLFRDFSVTISQHDFVTVVGSNGSGKSSLLNIICGSIPVDGGAIEINGKNITHLNEYRRANFIGRVFQDPAKGSSPNLTILENMAMADNKGKSFNLTSGINKKRIDGYRCLLSKLKLGLEDKIHVKVKSLSGGQRQALALLTSTMTPIEMLILDEHTAALDPKATETIMQLTDEIVRENKLTTLMVTHNLKYAVDYGNRIIMMHKGAIILDEFKNSEKKVDVPKLLGIFNDISIELGN